MTWNIPCRHMARRLSIALGALALTSVDLEPVLAADVSGSVEFEEAALERDGYIQAIGSPKFAKTVTDGVLVRVAVTYVEWAGEDAQATVLDWRIFDGGASAVAVAKFLAAAPISIGPLTSISDATIYTVTLLEGNKFQGTRPVTDIPGTDQIIPAPW